MTTESKPAQEVRLIYYSDLKSFGIPFSRSHLYVLMKENKFPKTMQLTDNKVAWLREEVEAWVQQKIDAHRAQEAAC